MIDEWWISDWKMMNEVVSDGWRKNVMRNE